MKYSSFYDIPVPKISGAVKTCHCKQAAKTK